MKIPIKGVIVPNDQKAVYELFGFDAVTPDDVIDKLEEADGKKVEVIINSPGGVVHAGSEIYTSLMDYRGNVEVKIVGEAASAGSLIAMAGGEVKISPTAQIMIHNVRGVADGDYRDMRHEGDVLENYNKSIANAYRLKSDLEEEELLNLMDEETWMTAQQAVENGFADEIMFDAGQQLVASAGNELMLDEETIKKARKILADDSGDSESDKGSDDVGDNELEEAEARLNLLKLKGADIDVN